MIKKPHNSTLWALKYLLKENRLSHTQIGQSLTDGLITGAEATQLYKQLKTLTTSTTDYGV